MKTKLLSRLGILFLMVGLTVLSVTPGAEAQVRRCFVVCPTQTTTPEACAGCCQDLCRNRLELDLCLTLCETL